MAGELRPGGGKLELGSGAGETLNIKTEEARYHMVQGFLGKANHLRISPPGNESHRGNGQGPSDT